MELQQSHVTLNLGLLEGWLRAYANDRWWGQKLMFDTWKVTERQTRFVTWCKKKHFHQAPLKNSPLAVKNYNNINWHKWNNKKNDCLILSIKLLPVAKWPFVSI